MSKPLRTEAEADRELEEAIRRYEGQRLGLGAEFLAAVDEVLERIQLLPKIGARVPRVPVDVAARRVSVDRFPYHIVYLETADAIRVLAFAARLLAGPLRTVPLASPGIYPWVGRRPRCDAAPFRRDAHTGISPQSPHGRSVKLHGINAKRAGDSARCRTSSTSS